VKELLYAKHIAQPDHESFKSVILNKGRIRFNWPYFNSYTVQN